MSLNDVRIVNETDLFSVYPVISNELIQRMKSGAADYESVRGCFYLLYDISRHDQHMTELGLMEIGIPANLQNLPLYLARMAGHDNDKDHLDEKHFSLAAVLVHVGLRKRKERSSNCLNINSKR
jgi:hypothetical protein